MKANRIFLCVLLVLTGILTSAVQAKEYPYIVLDSPSSTELPSGYRTATTAFSRKFRMPPREGLDTLRISASAQFSPDNFDKLIETIGQSDIVFVDLRQESHGFVNEQAVSWYEAYNQGNAFLVQEFIEPQEQSLLKNLRSQKQLKVFELQRQENDEEAFQPSTLSVNSVQSVEDFIKQKGYQYFRLYLQEDMPPQDSEIDKFVALVKNLPPTTWIHVFSANDLGRTTTIMAMFDMIHNAKDIQFKDIILRQQLLGGFDLSLIPSSTDWRLRYHKLRLAKLKSFYHYIKAEDGFERQSFTTWKHLQILPYFGHLQHRN